MTLSSARLFRQIAQVLYTLSNSPSVLFVTSLLALTFSVYQFDILSN